MEISSEEVEIPIPISSSYGGGYEHTIPTSSAPQTPSNCPTPTTLEDHLPYKRKVIRYKECLKNHAASMGGTATDGCGEFMPSGEEGTLEALTCSACHCHRNFHRKQVEGEPSPCEYCFYPSRIGAAKGLILGHHKNVWGAEPLCYPRPPLVVSYNMGSLYSESGGGRGAAERQFLVAKKRFRTKFSQEQKEKMLEFAEKCGWKIQKQEEGVVQQFCQEIGVKRRVLKVWMHNNKHTLAKKNPSSSENPI